MSKVSALLASIDAPPADGGFVRDPIEVGGALVSIQASWGHYSTPRVSGLRLSEYSSVEIAVRRKRGDGFLLPSSLGVEGFDDLFECDGGVAGYVPIEQARLLIEALLSA